MKVGKVLTMTEEEFARYQAQCPEVHIIHELPRQMQLGDARYKEYMKELTGSYSKWGNIPTVVDGLRFDSKGEANRYRTLLDWQAEGIISDLSTQHHDKKAHTWVVKDGYIVAMTGKRVRPIKYIDDFQYRITKSSILVVEDFKGKATTEFKFKEKLFRERFPDVHFFVNHSVKGWYDQNK